MLRTEQMDVHYGQALAIKNLDLIVEKSEIVAVVGANGAGKSTLLKTVAGVLKPSRGAILFEGQDISSSRPEKIVRLGISLVPEGRQIFAKLTVLENLEVGGYLDITGGRKCQCQEQIEKVFALFPGLKQRLSQPAGTLSGGEQQMLAIGRSMVSRPKLLMMDEPTMGLAPLIISELLRVIREIAAGGATVLLVEQNARFALAVARRGYVLELGKIVKTGSCEDIRNDQSVSIAYLGDVRSE